MKRKIQRCKEIKIEGETERDRKREESQRKGRGREMDREPCILKFKCC